MDKCVADCWGVLCANAMMGPYFAGATLVLDEMEPWWPRWVEAAGMVEVRISRAGLERLVELAMGNEQAERLLNGH